MIVLGSLLLLGILTRKTSGLSQDSNESYIYPIAQESYLIPNNPTIIPKRPKYKVKTLPYYLIGDNNPLYAGKCVGYVKDYTGIYFIEGNAIDWAKEINSDNPKLGSVIVLDMMPLHNKGHIGIIIDYTEDKVLMRSRTEWEVKNIWLDRNDSRILGYIDIDTLLFKLIIQTTGLKTYFWDNGFVPYSGFNVP